MKEMKEKYSFRERKKKKYLEQSGDGERLDFHLALVTPSDHKKPRLYFCFEGIVIFLFTIFNCKLLLNSQ